MNLLVQVFVSPVLKDRFGKMTAQGTQDLRGMLDFQKRALMVSSGVA